MEVPEIIWLSPNEYRSNEPSCFWSESQRTDYDIEYIRKEAFIEKACDWLFSHLTLFVLYYDNEEEKVKELDRSEFIKKFRKVMEE